MTTSPIASQSQVSTSSATHSMPNMVVRHMFAARAGLTYCGALSTCQSQPASVDLGDFPHSQHRPSVIHIGLQLPIIRGVQRRRWNFREADCASYTLATEHSIPLIPVNISVEESYQRFCGVMQKAARHSIPRGFRPTYTPYLDD